MSAGGPAGSNSTGSEIEVVPVLLARVAAWPFSAVLPLADPAAAEAAAALDVADDEVHEREALTSAAIAAAVPVLMATDEIDDVALRRRLLGLRRRLHTSVGPDPDAVPVADLLVDLAVELRDRAAGTPAGWDALGGAAAALRADDAARVAAEAARRRFRSAHVASEAAERRVLAVTVTGADFQRALALVAPPLWRQCRRVLADLADSVDPTQASGRSAVPAKARQRRRERTLLHLLLRAAGRPTPASAWAGVAPVHVSVPAADASAATLRPLLTFVAAPVRRSVQLDLATLAEPYRLLTGAGLPMGSDTWTVLHRAAGRLSGEREDRWRATAETVHRLAGALADGADHLAPADLAELHDSIRREIDELRAALGVGPWPGPAVVRVDLGMGLVGELDPSAVVSLASAVAAWERVHSSLGFGPWWADATAGALVPPVGASAGVVADATPVGRPTAPQRPAVPTVSAVATAAFGAAAGAEVEELVVRAEEWLGAAGSFSDPVLRPEVPPLPAHRLGPWGSLLAVPAVAVDGGLGWTVRSVRPEPTIFVARFASLHPGAFVAAVRAVAAIGATGGPPAVEVQPGAVVAPNAALAPPTGWPTLELGDPGAASPALLRSGDGHVGLPSGDGRVEVTDQRTGEAIVAVPVLVTAAQPVTAGPTDDAVVRACATWGWELVASGMPVLPGELADAGDGHLPAIEADGAVAHPERWLVSAARLRWCADGDDPTERFRRWCALARELEWPPWATIRLAVSPNEEDRLLPTASVLAVEGLLSSLPDDLVVAVVQRAPDPATLPVGPDGEQRVVELAATWVRR